MWCHSHQGPVDIFGLLGGGRFASALRLDRAGWRVDVGAPRPDGSVEVATCVPEGPSRGERLARLLEVPPVAQAGPAPGSYERWLKGGEVVFLEVLGSDGNLSAAVRRAGCSVAEPLPRDSLCYGARWDPSRPETRGRLT